jgi:hypothetical protein
MYMNNIKIKKGNRVRDIPRKPRKPKVKKIVNIMRKRFPFMDRFAKNGAGFGHSRGV